MGCDIHLRVQKFVNGKWEYAEEQIPDKYEPGKTTHERWYDGRNYNLFGILAGVRNGVGFAGIDMGDGFIPIAEPRGLPDGIEVNRATYEHDQLDDYRFWYGDHSHSWLTLSELLGCDWYQQSKCRGWVNGPQFEEWDRMKQWEPRPKEFCGGVSGGSVTHLTEADMRQCISEIKKMFTAWGEARKHIEEQYSSTYCRIEWSTFYSEAAGRFYTQTIPRMIRLAKTVGGPANVRIVFGFDS